MKHESGLRHGFTLIELLVVVAFIILFTSYSIGYYNQYTEEKRLENAGKKISTILDLVRVKSTSGDSSMCKGVTNARVDYYSFQVDNANEYSMGPRCLTGTPVPQRYRNEASIIFPTIPAPSPPFPVITFFPITGGSSCSYIYLKNTALNSPQGKCRYVKVSDSGFVKEDACATCDTCPNTCP